MNEMKRKDTNVVACMSCGSDSTTSRRETDSFEFAYGDEIVQLKAIVDVHSCADCGFEFTDSSAEDARHEAVCRFLGVLTPPEIKSIRTQYGYSRKQMATVSRIGEASLARWEAGSLIQSGAYDNYLFLLRYNENLVRVRSRLRGNYIETVIHDRKEWRVITETEALRAEQAAFSLTSRAA